MADPVPDATAALRRLFAPRHVAVFGGSAAAEVVRQCPSAAASHVLLAGLFAQFAALRGEVDAAMATGPAEWSALWQRDGKLLEIARTAREKRLEKALAALPL